MNDHRSTVPPWVTEPYRLWSLLDMNRILAGLVVIHHRDLANAFGLLSLRVVDGEGDHPLQSVPSSVAEIVRALNNFLGGEERIPLRQQMRWKIEDLKRRVEEDSSFRVIQAEALLKELHNDLLRELHGPCFLMIAAERRSLYEQRRPVFGEQVADQFPDASYDIAAAGRCLALDEWTAVVFHLMRVLEKGLHRLAAQVSIPMSSTVELENWKNIIDQIEKAIRSIEQDPKSALKSETLRVYSQLASNFWYFKEAWRNHVSHSRATYDEREATNTFNHTRAFMQELAGVGIA